MPTTTEATAARIALEAAMLNSIRDFETTNKVIVQHVQLEHLVTPDGQVSTMAVRLEVRLP